MTGPTFSAGAGNMSSVVMSSKGLMLNVLATTQNKIEVVKDDEVIHDNEPRKVYPLSEVDANYLILSSLFFLMPGYYAYISGLPLYLGTSTFTTLASVNYWRNAVPGWRRTTDMIVAKVSFLIYFLTGICRIKEMETLFIAWPICAVIAACYISSNKLWEKDSHTWIFFHMSFHFFVALEQYIVLVASFEKS
jgi:hypothetical protein